jgi:hypothetical protein
MRENKMMEKRQDNVKGETSSTHKGSMASEDLSLKSNYI